MELGQTDRQTDRQKTLGLVGLRLRSQKLSKDKKFNTDVKIGNESIETVRETELLGTIITDDLKWNKNTNNIVKEKRRKERANVHKVCNKLALSVCLFHFHQYNIKVGGGGNP